MPKKGIDSVVSIICDRACPMPTRLMALDSLSFLTPLSAQHHTALRALAEDRTEEWGLRGKVFIALSTQRPGHPDVYDWLEKLIENEAHDAWPPVFWVDIGRAQSLRGLLSPSTQKRMIEIAEHRDFSPEIRRAAFFSLRMGSVRSDRLVDSMWRLFRQDDEICWIQEQSGHILSKHRVWRFGVDDVLAQFIRDMSLLFSFRDLCLDWAVRIAPHVPQLIPIITERLRDEVEDPYLRCACIRHALRLTTSPFQDHELWSQSLQLAREFSESLYLRDIIIRSLFAFQNTEEKLIILIVEDINNEAFDVSYRENLLALLETGGSHVQDVILNIVSHLLRAPTREGSLRRAALVAAGRLPHISDELRQLALDIEDDNDEDSDLRVAALRLLQKHHIHQREPLLSMIERLNSGHVGDLDVALATVDCLLANPLRHHYIDSILFEIAINRCYDVSVRQHILNSLPQSILEASLPALIGLLQESYEQAPIYVSVCQLLSRCGAGDALANDVRQALIQLLSRSTPFSATEVEVAAMEALGLLFPHDGTTWVTLQAVRDDVNRANNTRSHAANLLRRYQSKR